jgi:hypothetical protein
MFTLVYTKRLGGVFIGTTSKRSFAAVQVGNSHGDSLVPSINRPENDDRRREGSGVGAVAEADAATDEADFGVRDYVVVSSAGIGAGRNEADDVRTSKPRFRGLCVSMRVAGVWGSTEQKTGLRLRCVTRAHYRMRYIEYAMGNVTDFRTILIPPGLVP